MKINLQRVNDSFHFEGTGISAVPVHLDASPDIGGENAGARPMELLLMAVGSCAAIDILLILKKQKQVIEDFSISVEGEREKLENTQPFKKIHIVFHLKGKIEAEKAARAVQLSVEKYCSVHTMLSEYAEITYEHRLN